MIQLSDIKTASPAVRQKARNTWIRKITPTQFKVVPKSPSKSKRIVVFLPDSKVMCIDAATGEECPASTFGVVCYHVLRAATHLAQLKKRKAA